MFHHDAEYAEECIHKSQTEKYDTHTEKQSITIPASGFAFGLRHSDLPGTVALRIPGVTVAESFVAIKQQPAV